MDKKSNWNEVIDTKTCDEKAELFQNMFLKKLNEFLPLKKRKISSDDQPFCNEKMKRLKRIKNREFQKNRKSLKWMDLNKQYKKEISLAKKKYYIKIVKDLKSSNPSQWYSKLKRLCSFDQNKSDPIIVDSIKNLSDKEQVEEIGNKFAKVSQEYNPLKTGDIKVPNFPDSSIPFFKLEQVKMKLQEIKINKAVPPNDIPPKIVKMFAAELAEPLCHIINSFIKMGAWGKLYKAEIITPVPKCFPPESLNDLRNISGLLTFNKIAEKLVAEMIIEDMTKKLHKVWS